MDVALLGGRFSLTRSATVRDEAEILDAPLRWAFVSADVSGELVGTLLIEARVWTTFDGDAPTIVVARARRRRTRTRLRSKSFEERIMSVLEEA